MDTDFPAGTRSIFARAASAEVRAAMAARRLTIRDLAKGAGFASHNYVAIRLRDEKPFTLDDVEQICRYLEEEPEQFVARAYRNHGERLFAESVDAQHDAADVQLETIGAWAEYLSDDAEGEHAMRRVREKHGNKKVDKAVATAFDVKSGQAARRRREMQQLEDQAARDEDAKR